MIKMRFKLPILAAAATMMLVAGCRKAEEAQPPVENRPVEQPKPVAAPLPAPKPVEAPKPKAPKAKPAPKPSADEQVQDDADATGMTARVDRSAGNGASEGTNSQP
jgi:outer membrane biosynthesis protein TonB